MMPEIDLDALDKDALIARVRALEAELVQLRQERDEEVAMLRKHIEIIDEKLDAKDAVIAAAMKFRNYYRLDGASQIKAWARLNAAVDALLARRQKQEVPSG